MNLDDLPPVEGHDPEDDTTFGGSLGGIFGAAVLCALFIGAAGVMVYALIHWIH